MVIPIDSLRSLPEGAAYVERQNQATALVKRKGDQLVVTASCDSLQQVVFDLIEELHRARDETENSEVISEPVKPSFLQRLKWCLIGAVAGFILGIIIKIKR